MPAAPKTSSFTAKAIARGGFGPVIYHPAVLRQALARVAAGAALVLPAPLLAGEWPDPSVLRVGHEHVAVTTTDDWAPIFRVARSSNLRGWRLTGAVFQTRPRWARSDFWAPELARIGGRYAVFYSALPHRRRRSWMCLGVATAATPDGPWRDAGRPLRCSRYGSIDPHPVRDERGRLYLLFKEDGNQFERPTPILAQRLREDGRKLLGRPRELFRADRRWEGTVVEAPQVVRSRGWFHLLYAGNFCCSPDCDYAVGAARSRRLLGPWRKRSKPILRGGNGWNCPGHATVVGDGAGGRLALFHAFRDGAGRIAGRQMLAAQFRIGADGWPRIGPGRRVPAPRPGAPGLAFSEAFAGPLAIDWEWRLANPPRIETGDGLRLTAAAANGDRLDGAVLGRRVGTERYTAVAVLDRDSLAPGAQGGVASFRDGYEVIGLSAGRDRATVWRRKAGRLKRLASTAVPAVPRLHLRMVARGNRFLFELSGDGVTWQPVTRGFIRGPIEESARPALTVGGATGAQARFESVAVTED